jgi:hypothetical protein
VDDFVAVVTPDDFWSSLALETLAATEPIDRDWRIPGPRGERHFQIRAATEHFGTPHTPSLIATVRDDKGAELPALAVQRFGRGRTAALMVGDMWRWGMKDASAQADLARAWRQMVRWLIADVPARVQVTAEPVAASDPAGGPTES